MTDPHTPSRDDDSARSDLWPRLLESYEHLEAQATDFRGALVLHDHPVGALCWTPCPVYRELVEGAAMSFDANVGPYLDLATQAIAEGVVHIARHQVIDSRHGGRVEYDTPVTTPISRPLPSDDDLVRERLDDHRARILELEERADKVDQLDDLMTSLLANQTEITRLLEGAEGPTRYTGEGEAVAPYVVGTTDTDQSWGVLEDLLNADPRARAAYDSGAGILLVPTPVPSYPGEQRVEGVTVSEEMRETIDEFQQAALRTAAEQGWDVTPPEDAKLDVLEATREIREEAIRRFRDGIDLDPHLLKESTGPILDPEVHGSMARSQQRWEETYWRTLFNRAQEDLVKLREAVALAADIARSEAGTVMERRGPHDRGAVALWNLANHLDEEVLDRDGLKEESS